MDVKGPEPAPTSTDTGPPPAPASASVPSPRPADSSASLSARMEARLSKGDEVAAAHAVAASMLSIMSSTPLSQMSINPGTDTQSLLGATSPRSVAGSFSESLAGSALSRNVSSLGNNAHVMPALLPSGPMSTSAQLAKFPHLALSGLHVPVEPAVNAGGSTKGSAASASSANGTASSTTVTPTPNGNTAGGATTGYGIVSSVLGKGFDELSFSQQLHIFWCWIDELSQAQRRYIQEGLRRRIAFHDFCEAETSDHNGHKTLGSTGGSNGNGNAGSGSSGNGRVSSPASQSSGSGNSPPSSSGGDASCNGKRSNSSSDTGWSSKSSGAEAGKGSSISAHHHKKDVHASAVSAASSAHSSTEGVAPSHSSQRQGGSSSAGTSLSSSHHSSGRPSKSHQQPMMASSSASSVSSVSSSSSSSSNSSVSALTESNLKLNNMKQDIAKKRRAARTAAAVNMTCAQCHTSSSPEWRKGPDGLKSLCNACGLRFSKRTRREIMDDERSHFSEAIMIPLTTSRVVAGGFSHYVTPSPSDYEAATAIASIRNAAAAGGALPSFTQPQQAPARRPSQPSLSDALSPSDMAPVSLMPQPQPQPRISHGLAEVVQNGVPVLPSLASLVPTKALLSPSIDSANANSPFQPLRSPPMEAVPVNPLASVPVRRKRDE